MSKRISFPTPTKIDNRNYWMMRELRVYRARLRGELDPAPQPDDENMVNARRTRNLFGDVSAMWIWRKLPHGGEGADAEFSAVSAGQAGHGGGNQSVAACGDARPSVESTTICWLVD